MWRNLLFAVSFAFLFAGCGTVKQVPVETKTEIHYIDSLIVRDSVIFYPRERIVDIVPQYDTLKLSIEAAESSAWIDTSFHCLRGEIRAKNGQRKEIIERVKTEYKDSIITKEIPVPYKVEIEKKYVPFIFKFSMVYFIMSLLIIFYRIYKYFKK